MKTTLATVAIIRPKVLACPAASRNDRLTLPRRHRFNIVTTGVVLLPSLPSTIRRLPAAQACNAVHDLPPAA